MLPEHNDPDEPAWIWRSVKPYNDEDGGDCIMTIEDFISSVSVGAFNDFDGFGECATMDVDGSIAISNVRIYPSNLDRPSWTTHVCWYNK